MKSKEINIDKVMSSFKKSLINFSETKKKKQNFKSFILKGLKCKKCGSEARILPTPFEIKSVSFSPLSTVYTIKNVQKCVI